MSALIIIGVIGVVVVIGVVIVIGVYKKETVLVEKVEETSFFVDTKIIEIKNYNPKNVSFGSIFSSRQANLTFPIVGEVAEISEKFKSGEFVKQGTILAQLDNFNQIINLNDLKVQIALNKSQSDEIKSEIEMDKLHLKELENQLNIRKKQKTRIISMLKSKATTDSALDNVQLAVSNAKSNILSRKQNISRLNYKLEQLNLSEKRLNISIKKVKKSIEDGNHRKELMDAFNRPSKKEMAEIAKEQELAEFKRMTKT